MSDWSLVSGKSLNDNELPEERSDNDFTLVDRPSVLAALTSALTSANGPTSNAQVEAWLGIQLEETTADPSINQRLAPNHEWVQLPRATPSVLPLEIKTLKIYTLKLAELPRSHLTPGYFTIVQHPSTWYASVAGSNADSPLSSAIFTSIELITRKHGDNGILQVILWARVFNTKDSNGGFWKDVEEAALRRLPKQDILVKVGGYMRSIRGRASPRLARKYDLKEFFEGDECWFVVKFNGGFEWMLPGEAVMFKLGKEIAS